VLLNLEKLDEEIIYFLDFKNSGNVTP